MIDVMAGRMADPDMVRARADGFRLAARLGVFLAALTLMLLPAAVGVLVLAGVIS